MARDDLVRRLERVEAQLAIQQLPIRYALAIDGRDLDAWVALFEPDVNLGRHGRGRATLRTIIDGQVRNFYRSVHQIVGHRVDLGEDGTASGAVYCRAEHEVGDRWIVMAICYFDEYKRVDGDWFFAPPPRASLVRRRPDGATAERRLRLVALVRRPAGAAGALPTLDRVLGGDGPRRDHGIALTPM